MSNIKQLGVAFWRKNKKINTTASSTEGQLFVITWLWPSCFLGDSSEVSCCFMQKKKIRKEFSIINKPIIFSLIKKPSWAITKFHHFYQPFLSSIVGSTKSFHLCTYNNLAIVFMYKNKVPKFFFQLFAYQSQKKKLRPQFYINLKNSLKQFVYLNFLPYPSNMIKCPFILQHF